MALQDDLLAQAQHLLNRDTNRPKQANLRRAVSTAYYALFHLLVDEASQACAPAAPSDLRRQVSRAFAHLTMADACKSFSGTTLPEGLARIMPDGVPSDIQSVASAFVKLQQARHTADYDVATTHKRTQVEQNLRLCSKAFADWRAVRGTPAANVFLVALLLGKKWDR